MKNYTLLLALFSFIRLEAQETFIPIGKAKSKTEFISLKIPEDLKSLNKLVNSKNSCIGIKANLHEANTLEIKELMIFLKQMQDLNHLELHYQTDSLQIEDVCYLKNIQKLRLYGSSNQYPQIDKLSTLNQLECLGLNNITLNTMPVQLFRQTQFNEIELLCDTMTYVMATERILHYKMDSLNKKRIYISSYCEDIDLTGDSMYSVLINNIPGSVKYLRSKRQAYDGKENSTSNDELISTISSKIYPNFKPLFPNEKKKYELASIIPTSSNSLVFNDNTIINIPENSFVNKEGKLVKSEVKIVYQSIRTQADILRTGIPMTFDTANKTAFFKTNGMFEIKAYSGDEELQLKQGASISVDFPAKNDNLNYNLYSMNADKGQWESTKKALNFENRSEWYFSYKDKATMQDRFNDLEYTYVLPKNIQNGTVTWNKHKIWNKQNHIYCDISISDRKNSNKVRSDRNLVKFRNFQDITNKENPKLYIEFILFNNNNDATQTLKLFPELNAFKNFKFEMETYEKSSQFYKKFRKGKIYNDIRIHYEPGDDYGIIELKSKNGFVEFRFKVSYINKKGHSRIQTQFLKAYRKYSKILADREFKFNSQLNMVFKGRNPSSLIYRQIPRHDSIKNANYLMEIPLLGIYNCDRLYLIEDMISINTPTFKFQETIINDVQTIYVVDSAADGTYTFNKANIKLSLKNTVGIIIVTMTGIVYTIKNEILKTLNLTEQTEAILPMQIVPTDTDSDQTIKSLGGG